MNPFSAKLNKALWAALEAGKGGDGDLRVALSKESAAGVLSLLFQTGFSGRAEIGLIGDHILTVKTSADGATWRNSLVVDPQWGMPGLPLAPAALSAPNLLINGGFALNQRGFGGGALANGTYGFDRWRAAAAGTSVSSPLVWSRSVQARSRSRSAEPQPWDLVADPAGRRLVGKPER
jgi:hypothetical protein